MKVKITAGTHIGIVGCYGEKTITIRGIDPEDEVRKFIFDEFYDEITHGYYEWKKDYHHSSSIRYRFINEHGETKLEYFYKKV
jgi:hypothetical protein